jgi:hypothetical protein
MRAARIEFIGGSPTARGNIIDVPKCGRDLLDLIGRHSILFQALLPFSHGFPDSCLPVPLPGASAVQPAKLALGSRR